jgi:hypothetical protein
MLKDVKIFVGVYFRDNLPKKPLLNEIGILNLDQIKNPGTHWTFWYKKGENCFYFDSFGMKPCEELCDYLQTIPNYSDYVIQVLNTNYCGHLCILVINLIIQGFSFQEAILTIFKKRRLLYNLSKPLH